MRERLEAFLRWFRQSQWDGQDAMGTFEVSVGIAVLISNLIMAAASRSTVLLNILAAFLLAAGVWWGSRSEHLQLRSLGSRHAPGTLFLGITWLLAGIALLFSLLVLLISHLTGLSDLSGWAAGPILLTAFIASLSLMQGLRLGITRLIILGGVLAVYLFVMPLLVGHLYLTTALIVGGALIACGFIGRRVYLHRLEV